MSVESAGTPVDEIDPESDEEEWVGEYCAWWVIPCGYASLRSGFVHVPDAVRTGEGNDPDEEPSADTLCHMDHRESTDYRTKSHVVYPVGFKDVCTLCKRELKEVIDDEQ